jgi:hypothetical protein
MLDTTTKRRIDTARDILVGKVPDPKSQVEQITIALIYKFMDYMDAESEELGGKRKFFTQEFARYGWAKLMDPSIGGHEMIGIYGEGISKMPENPGIPPLFRDIFKNSYLPYRDPETLKAFLKIIDEFSYDHSERLGDAFEYLLSVLGSQGDAGQFRSQRFNDAVMGQLKGAQLPRIGWSSFAELQIPLPPLEVQKEIVAEIEGYQQEIRNYELEITKCREKIAKAVNKVWSADED